MHRYHPNGFKILNENHTYTKTEQMSEAYRQLDESILERLYKLFQEYFGELPDSPIDPSFGGRNRAIPMPSVPMMKEAYTYGELLEACRQVESYVQLNEAGPLGLPLAKQVLRLVGKYGGYAGAADDAASHGLGADGILPKIPGTSIDIDDYNDEDYDDGGIMGGIDNMFTGAAAGGALGSVVPVVGTAAGGAAGAALALLYSLLTDPNTPKTPESGPLRKYGSTPFGYSRYGR